MTRRARGFSVFAAAGMMVLALQTGCSSAGSAGGSGGSPGGTGNTGGGTGNTSGGTGGMGGVTGGMGGGDAVCTNATARSGAGPCTQDCVLVRQSGLGSLGTRNCTCANTVYSNCTVVKPAEWAGTPLAGCCPAGSTIATQKGMPCDTEWAECITIDAMAGTTYQGCACLRDPASQSLLWACGSTNKWFTLDTTTTGGATTCM